MLKNINVKVRKIIQFFPTFFWKSFCLSRFNALFNGHKNLSLSLNWSAWRPQNLKKICPQIARLLLWVVLRTQNLSKIYQLEFWMIFETIFERFWAKRPIAWVGLEASKSQENLLENRSIAFWRNFWANFWEILSEATGLAWVGLEASKS